jgi:hypothetical protein
LRTNDGPSSGLVPYVRTVETRAGATAVLVVYSSRADHGTSSSLAWPNDKAGLEALKAARIYENAVA